MTWSNEYKQSIRDQEIFDEISSVEKGCLKVTESILLTISFIVLSNVITAITVTERLEKIEHKLEITRERNTWWILEEIFGDKK